MARTQRKARTGKQIRVPAFGRYLQACRRRSRKKPPSVQAVATQLRDRGVNVDQATLRGYEYGWVDSPDPVVLLELSRVFKIDLVCLIEVLHANRKQRDLSELDVERVLRTVGETFHAETGAADRLAEIEQRIFALGTELVELSGDRPGGQTTETRARPTERRKGH